MTKPSRSSSKTFLVFACLLLNIYCTSAAAPVATHLSVVVAKNEEVVMNLFGFDADGDQLSATVTSLPASGDLYQLSSVFNSHGYEPKLGTKITSVGTVVGGKNNRLIYKPHKNLNAPLGKWAEFTYTVTDGTSISNQGIVTLVSSSKVIVGSNFNSNSDGWSTVNNGGDTSVSYAAASRGPLNHYIWSKEKEINLNQATNTDKDAWMFLAPSKFLGNHVIAYGGSIEFDMSSASGDFSAPQRNSQQHLVELYCATCASQRGIRLYRALEAGTAFSGAPTHMSIPLLASGWLKDSKNSLVANQAPTNCELSEVLEGITSFKILGDFTQWHESIGVDNVHFKAGSGVPLACYATLR